MQEPEELLESLTLVSARPEWKSSFSEKLRKRERTPNWLARFLLGLTVLVGGSYAWQQVQYARLGWNVEVPKVTPAPERPQLFPLILADQRDELKRQLGQNPTLLEKTGLRDLTPIHYALLLGRFKCAQILLEQDLGVPQIFHNRRGGVRGLRRLRRSRRSRRRVRPE